MTRIGNYTLHKTADGQYLLRTLDGQTVGTFPTAKRATEHGIALIAAAHKAGRLTATTIKCEHECGVCGRDALMFVEWSGPDAWWNCSECDEGHTSWDCCSPVRGLNNA